MTHSRFAGASVALAAVLAFSGCGSPADNLTFKAPAGWQSSPAMGYVQFWKSPRHKGEILILIKSPKPLQETEVFNSANLKDARVETQKPIAICGNQQAQYFKAQGTSNGNDSNIEMIMTNAAGTTYMAMYVYPEASAPDADASGALRQLCAKQ